jgi:hypothetical protein
MLDGPLVNQYFGGRLTALVEAANLTAAREHLLRLVRAFSTAFCLFIGSDERQPAVKEG